MTNIIIKVNLENDAFKGSNAELSRVLRNLADKISCYDEIPTILKDVNGNVCGSVDLS